MSAPTTERPPPYRTAKAVAARKEAAARRLALADPAAVARAARVVRHAIDLGLLTVAEVDPRRDAR